MGLLGPIWAQTHTGLMGWPSVRSRCSGVAVRPCKLRPKRRPWNLQVGFSHKNWQRFPIVSECFLCWYHLYWSPKVGLKQTKVHTSWILKVACDNLEIEKKIYKNVMSLSMKYFKNRFLKNFNYLSALIVLCRPNFLHFYFSI